MSINADAAFTALEKHFDRAFVAVQRAGKKYSKLPDPILRSPRTNACFLNDYVFHEIVAEFDEVSGVRPQYDRKNQLRFLSIDDIVLLWLKKVDLERVSSNVLTRHAREMRNGQATFDFVPQASVVVLGYLFDAETGLLKRISFAPPSRKQPPWYVDIEPGDTTVVEFSSPKQPRSQSQRPTHLKITRGARQMKL